MPERCDPHDAAVQTSRGPALHSPSARCAAAEDGGLAAPVLLAEGTEFAGLLALDGPARIDGRLRGEVIGSGPLFIGPRASVEARVETDELVVAGVLAGDVRASRRIALAGTARVRGELSTPSLSLAEGALLEGRCTAGLPSESGDAAQDPGPPSS
jgi:cytoskeletal protein CcmA (bactofilin family)